MRAFLLSALLLVAPPAFGASLTMLDGLGFYPFAPALELHPTLADRVLAACGLLPSAFTVAVPADAKPFVVGPNYFVPGSLDCSESGGGTPSVANLWLEDASRAWLATSVCDLAVPFDPGTGMGVQVRYQIVLVQHTVQQVLHDGVVLVTESGVANDHTFVLGTFFW